MNLIRFFILLLLVYDISSEIIKKKHSQKHNKKNKHSCCYKRKRGSRKASEKIHKKQNYLENVRANVERDDNGMNPNPGPNVPNEIALDGSTDTRVDIDKFKTRTLMNPDMNPSSQDIPEGLLRAKINEFLGMFIKALTDLDITSDFSKLRLNDILGQECSKILFTEELEREFSKVELISLPMKEFINSENLKQLELFSEKTSGHDFLEGVLKLSLKEISDKLKEKLIKLSLHSEDNGIILENILTLPLAEILDMKNSGGHNQMNVRRIIENENPLVLSKSSTIDADVAERIISRKEDERMLLMKLLLKNIVEKNNREVQKLRFEELKDKENMEIFLKMILFKYLSNIRNRGKEGMDDERNKHVSNLMEWTRNKNMNDDGDKMRLLHIHPFFSRTDAPFSLASNHPPFASYGYIKGENWNQYPSYYGHGEYYDTSSEFVVDDDEEDGDGDGDYICECYYDYDEYDRYGY